MLEKYEELVLAGKEPIARKVIGVPAVVGYDVELEKQRLEFKMRQWEAVKAEREEQRKVELARLEAEKARLEADRAEREEQRRVETAKWKDEKAEREARLEFERYSRETERAAEAVFRASQLDFASDSLMTFCTLIYIFAATANHFIRGESTVGKGQKLYEGYTIEEIRRGFKKLCH